MAFEADDASTELATGSVPGGSEELRVGAEAKSQSSLRFLQLEHTGLLSSHFQSLGNCIRLGGLSIPLLYELCNSCNRSAIFDAVASSPCRQAHPDMMNYLRLQNRGYCQS